MKPQPLTWRDPLELAYSLNAPAMVLLHSSAQTHYSGERSLLAVGLRESVDINHFSELEALLHSTQHRYDNCWFGYLGYELKHDCESYRPAEPNTFGLPRGRMMKFSHIYEFDHTAKTLTLWVDGTTLPPQPTPLPVFQPPALSSLSSNMSKQDYLDKVSQLLDYIARGDLYQANLTRKFYGTWESPPDSIQLFAHMCRTTPAPYSALIRMHGVDVLSSSPELFLRCDASGMVETRPIKGTIGRGKTPQEDASNKLALANSTKNRAENLMIVDLMRNDLARSCNPSSIKVSQLFDVNTHATIHHMASSITGQLYDTTSRTDLIRGCFPPGSMTGAPKIQAVELCNMLEKVERGVYSGALGWLAGDGSLELSVVIRTLIIQQNRFEFQVGGGIVADSEPELEWQETIDKSMGILKSLNITRQRMEAL